MPGAFIPPNWDVGGPLRDVTYTLPDDAEWRGLLDGMFARLLYEYAWDKVSERIGGGGGGSTNPQISASFNDASVRSDSSSTVLTAVSIRGDASPVDADRWNGGLYFPAMPIPSGVSITSAFITVQPISTTHDSPNLDLVGQLEPDALDFDTDTRFNSRPKTSASVPWVDTDIGTAPTNSPDLTGVIQEIIDQVGWSSGNGLALFLQGRSDFVSTFRFESWDANPLLAASLFVSWSGGSSFIIQDAIDTALEILDSKVIAP